MRKTVTITIGGALFHIEEDAYRALDEYLRAIRSHFATYPDHEEIVSDIEGRIAEEFTDVLKEKKRAAVSQTDVAELIARMGTVKDFQEFTSAEIPAPAAAADSPRRARLYRNVDDQILGGVCSGLATYVGVDPVIPRLAFALSVLMGGFGVILYILLWIILPAATTAAEKVEMAQGHVTLSAIEKRVNAAITPERRGSLRRAIQVPFDLLRALVYAIGAALRAILPLLVRVIGFGILAATAAGIAFASFLFLVLLINPDSPYIGFPLRDAVGPSLYAGLLVGGYLTLLLPLLLVVLLGVALLLLRRVTSAVAVAVFIGLWLAAIVATGVAGFVAGPDIEAAAERFEAQNMVTVTKAFDLSGFDRVEAGGNAEVTVTRGTGFSVRVTGGESVLSAGVVSLDDGVLRLHPERDDDPCIIFCVRSPLSAAITMPAFAGGKAYGVANLAVSGFTAETMRLEANGAAQIDADVNAQELDVAMNGVAHVELRGSGTLLRVALNGPSSLGAYQYPVTDAEVMLAGPARAMIDAAHSITGGISGPGSVRYRRRPARLEVDVDGPGWVGQQDEDVQERW